MPTKMITTNFIRDTSVCSGASEDGEPFSLETFEEVMPSTGTGSSATTENGEYAAKPLHQDLLLLAETQTETQLSG